MRLEDHLNRARQLWMASGSARDTQALEEIITAIMLAAGGPTSILNCRKTMSDAFKEDPDFRRAYTDNIGCVIMDFEAHRHFGPSVVTGPMSVEQRNILADRILAVIFDT